MNKKERRLRLQAIHSLAIMAMPKLIHFESNNISMGLAFPPKQIAQAAYEIGEAMVKEEEALYKREKENE